MAPIQLKTATEIELLREANQMVSEALTLVGQAAEPGVTTWDLDQVARGYCDRRRVKPAFLGLYGFPASLCVSVNEEVVHGIPSKQRKLKHGDIVSCDFGVRHRGFYGDAARTFPVGKISSQAQRLLRTTEDALMLGIEQCIVGNRLGDIGHAVQAHAEANGFSVVRDFVGHGIGRRPHEAPQVQNFGRPGRGRRLEAGLVIAIEPMVNAGDSGVRVLSDDWTVVTRDGRLSAHFEHSVAITDDGPQILSLDSTRSEWTGPGFSAK